MTTTTRRRIMANRRGVTFLWPELETIRDVVEQTWIPEYQMAPSDPEAYFPLTYIRVEGQLTQLEVKIRKAVYRALKYQAPVDHLSVIRSGWPEPYALVKATDPTGLVCSAITLIDRDDYQAWYDQLV